ncbi:hypothetical protein [Altererythrobacter sp. Root672]|uniref:hypothetical protein n=1 Tax=Altererythrobacter sp. Root672 TaxID=1736584 RepID=UPI000701EE26|nr:hypothetical protein [Altererythrobacter sp. Root672]KRA79385.1 hypothetical protein ASD76_17580 [Altererythrobacter sp. Root672]
MRILLALCALALLPSAAHAEWLEASSAHFVVYADDTERDVRKFSEQLERYHAAMEIVTGLESQIPSPSNRVTVFVVKNPRQVQRLAGTNNRDVYGFYVPRAGGSVAFVPRVEVKSGQPDFSMIALLHEYAHHFLLSNSRFPSPRWFGEGGAEFFASAEFTAAGGVSVGMPANHRGWELALARNIKVAELVDPEAYEKKSRGSYDAFYGKSWLLYHYLTFTPERSGQLRRYVGAMANGKTSRQAAEEVFGDLDQLERELQRYLDQRTMLSLRFAPEQLVIQPVTVRRISKGEEEMMPVRVRSRRGVTSEQAAEIVLDARKVAARYPADAPVLAALAEAEFDAGNDAEAIAAADAALALDPGQVNAYVQKGFALFRGAAEAEDLPAAYRKAVAPFLALNKLENDHPLPLIFYFRSFVESGRKPPEAAVHGLERAADLAPYDLGLQMMVANHLISESNYAEARYHLVPIAYSPHPGSLSGPARMVIERIDAGSVESPEELVQLFSAAGAKDAPATEGSEE